MDNADTGTDEPSKFVAMLPNMLLTRHERARHGFDNAPAPPSGTHRPKLRVPAPPRPARQVSLSTNGVADGNSPIKEYLSLREDAPRRKLPSYAGPNSPRLSIAPPQKPSVAGRRRRILRPAASEGFSSTKQRYGWMLQRLFTQTCFAPNGLWLPPCFACVLCPQRSHAPCIWRHSFHQSWKSGLSGSLACWRVGEGKNCCSAASSHQSA